MSRVRFVLLLLLLLLAPGCDREVPSLQVDRHRAEIVVQPDGSLLVTEEFQGRPLDRARTFERRVESPRADGITLLAASLDGQVLAAGEPGEATLDVLQRGDVLHVRWELEAGTAGADPPAGHTFGLRYRVTAATEIVPERGRVIWPVLPAGRQYAVGESQIVLILPENAEWLRGTGIAEAGWTVEARDRGVAAGHSYVGLDPATLLAEFTIDRQVITLPYWQVTEDLRSEFALAFVAGGLFVVVIGAGVLWLVGFQYRVPRARPLQRPALVREWREPLSPSEAAALADPLRANREALQVLIERGLIDRERLTVAQGLRTTAWAGGLLGAACAVVAELTLGRFGWWAQVIPLSLVLLAAVFLVSGRRFEVLTESGRTAQGAGR